MDGFATNIGEEPRFDPDARFISSEKVLALCLGLIVKTSRAVNISSAQKVKKYKECVQIAHYSAKE